MIQHPKEQLLKPGRSLFLSRVQPGGRPLRADVMSLMSEACAPPLLLLGQVRLPSAWLLHSPSWMQMLHSWCPHCSGRKEVGQGPLPPVNDTSQRRTIYFCSDVLSRAQKWALRAAGRQSPYSGHPTTGQSQGLFTWEEGQAHQQSLSKKEQPTLVTFFCAWDVCTSGAYTIDT